MPTMPIEQILVDPRCQARADLNEDAIAEYAERLADGEDLGEIDVFEVDGARYVTDGFHRRGAHIVAGKSFAVVRVVGKGTMEQAIWHATSANKHHGVRRTNADKRRAVELAFESGFAADLSNGAIAKHIGVSDVFVSRVRTAWESAHRVQTFPPAETPTRLGTDGKRYPVQPKAAPEPVATEYEPDPLADVPALADVPEAPAPSLPAFGAELTRYEASLRGVRLGARSLPDELHSLKQRLEVGVKALENALVAAIPESCPACSGAGCVRCDDRGWVPGAVAVEMRERTEARA